jgi:2-succinyl-6-hydroxy-2,4-cyclohexadiene-1-carboxylate synthase
VTERLVTQIAPGLAARVQGEGTKVLWLHGYTLDSSSWREMWRRLPGYCHVGLDLPGHGGSAPVGPQDNLHVLARRVADVCLDQGIRHIVALSFGTLTATQVVLEEPDHFRSLVLAAPTLAGGPQDPEVGLAYSKLAVLHRGGARGREMRDAWMSCIAWNGIEKNPALREELGLLVERHPWRELEDWAMLRLMHPPHREEDLRRIRTPTLILIGDLDLPAFHQSAGILERSLPSCRRVDLADTHHLCILESPGLSAGPIREHLLAHDRPSFTAGPEEGRP